jgi:hypothetical protein
MKRLIFIAVALALLGSALALNVTHLEIINKTKYEVQYKGVSQHNPNIRFYEILAPANDSPTSKILTIIATAYWVEVYARELEVKPTDDGFVYEVGEFFPCFGFADGMYYDDDRAARLMWFGKGNRKLVINDNNCRIIPDIVRTKWVNLPLKKFEYEQGLFSYKY